MKRGKLIAIEGLDGAGTTTQVAKLQRRLQARGIEVYKTRQPTNGPFGMIAGLHVRQDVHLNEYAMALGFTADRMDHIESEIEPQLSEGIWVLSDRYYLSTFAYQTAKLAIVDGTEPPVIDWAKADKLLAWIMTLNEFAYVPDVTYFLDVPPAVCAVRARRDRWHRERYDEGAMPYLANSMYKRAIQVLQKRGDVILTVAGDNTVPDTLAADLEASIIKLFRTEATFRRREPATEGQLSMLQD